MTEVQTQLIDSVYDLLEETDVNLDEAVDPILFIATDLLAQLHDYEIDPEMAKKLSLFFFRALLFHCMEETDPVNITIQ